MRIRIIDSILARMCTDERVFFLTADMGINLVEKIQARFPNRYLNVGIAEQNLIGIAAGLANCGYRPFAYTISNFATHRCFEQLRNDVGIHQHPVTIMGTSAGFENAALGPTHHIIDDWGAVNNIPGIDIYAPVSVAAAENVVDTVLRRERPAYVRISKGAPVSPASGDDAIYLEAKARTETAAPGVLLVSYGSSVQQCLEVQAAHDNVGLLVYNRLRPLDAAVTEKALRAHKQAYVVEDHFGACGLYGVLCRFVMEHGLTTRLVSIAPADGYTMKVGASPAFYNRLNRLDKRGIEEIIANS